LTFAQYPALKNSGGSAQVSATGYSDPTCGQNGIIVFENGGSYVALSSSCTHACCTVALSGTELKCPCHGATFDLTGQPLSSKAPTALQSLTVCSDSNGVYVTIP
jgi:Rieske Fe-S protein